jgi:hypothetical protein
VSLTIQSYRIQFRSQCKIRTGSFTGAIVRTATKEYRPLAVETSGRLYALHKAVLVDETRLALSVCEHTPSRWWTERGA